MEFYAIDVETTGLDPDRDEIIEVAWAHFAGGELRGTFTSLLQPARRPPDEILQLTGISRAELADAPPPALVLGEVLRASAGLRPVLLRARGPQPAPPRRFRSAAGSRRRAAERGGEDC